MIQLGRLTGTTFTLLNGEVRSVQPDGAIQTRPAGSTGVYEQVAISGTLATYCPVFEQTANVYVYLYVPQVPNQPAGVGGMGTVAIPA